MKSSLEIWKPIKGLEKFFEVSNKGRVKSLERVVFAGSRGAKRILPERIMKQRVSRKYLAVWLELSIGEFKFRRGVSVHRLVAHEFHENPLRKKTVNHINGDKLDNRAENLEWATHSENTKHAFANGLMPKPKGNLKFSPETILKVFELRKKDMMHKEIAKELGMGISTVTHILLGSKGYFEFKKLSTSNPTETP